MKDTEILTRIYGTAEALHWLPLLRSLGSHTNAVGAWHAVYAERGLGFGVDRPTVEALRRLTAAGYLATSGATQGKSHRLTVEGVLAAQAALGISRNAADMLLAIIEAEGVSRITLPGTDAKLVMCWEIVPSAGEWLTTASASDRAWKKYQHDLAALSVALAPLLVLGLVTLYTDGGGRLWGVNSTAAGRVAEWPEAPTIKADTDSFWTAFEAGYDAGTEYQHKPVPADYHAMVTRTLPSSKWF